MVTCESPALVEVNEHVRHPCLRTLREPSASNLRRTGLCSLLDIPEGPGLSDALLNDEPAPIELVVPVQGGTFHLLPAGGTPPA